MLWGEHKGSPWARASQPLTVDIWGWVILCWGRGLSRAPYVSTQGPEDIYIYIQVQPTSTSVAPSEASARLV